ncbi:glutamine-hydrolyzing GMP synthase [Phycisphaerales bacterium AB-hyl4]|uniref:GMP synthase [glutamine-hydrolyzing] n=1 Tax=Natronomicrosphaera hydrolytica TaxID=3242702 RepID=A0ABV4U3J2_9BACT
MTTSAPASAAIDAILADLPPGVQGQVVPIVDFGSQYVQLIARRVREAGVYSMLVGPNITVEQLKALNPRGIILSGGPSSVYEENAPTCDPKLFDLGVPVLGICYGMQVACQLLGAQIKNATAREYGRAQLRIENDADLLHGIPANTSVWMSHGDQVVALPEDFEPLATTPTCPYAAVRHKQHKFYGVQFHPEVTHTPHGHDILGNFLFNICQCKGNWHMADFLEAESNRIRNIVGDKHVICGLSGGVDSSVVAALLHKAIGDQLTCIFVDNGLLRKGERELVEQTFRDHFEIDLRVIDAADDFLNDLEGIEDPQEKRRRIGHRFIEVFKQTAAEIKSEIQNSKSDIQFLAQGTLYPDVIESGQGYSGAAANIKLHHNVGGLPEELGFDLIEPLRALFKDEARKLGEVLGLPDAIVWRHPFPGPGLAVRVLGAITRDKLDLLRDADEILLEEIVANNLYRRTAQVFVVLLPVKSVGVMGDGRTYDSVAAVRAVESQDFMTADWARIPYDVLATISNRIINEVRGINRVVYDISSKPPATIEWE